MLSDKFKISSFLLFFSFFINAQITYESAFPNISFEFPVEIQEPGDGTDRIFVVEQRGRIKVFDNISNVSSNQVSTFLDITDRVRFSTGQEIGLLGLAFHPNFENNGYFYVYYTANSSVSGVSVKIVLSRFSANPNDENDALETSELVLFEFDKNQNNSNHNGGKIAFGNEGYLYISVGDGGGGNDPRGNGQNINTIFGSICRIDVDLDGSNPVETTAQLPNGNYEVPIDNPFYDTAGLDEIFAYGIRNTWKFSIDRLTGNLWGADVGQNQFEEINLIKKDLNYGWSRFEGDVVANSGVTIAGDVEPPIFTYNRSQGDRSITGGYVYRGTEITSLSPDINSKYIFGDFVSGRVWALNYNPTTKESSSTLLFRTSGQSISSFGLDSKGELYFSNYGSSSQLYKLIDGTSTNNGTIVSGVGEWQILENTNLNGEVLAVETSSNGDVYFGGNFNLSGTNSINNIAVWNTTSGWQGLGGGTNGLINSIKISPNGDLYAAGVFSEIGGISANNIAKWNGSEWSALGNGIDGSISAIAIDNNNTLYVGGIFEDVQGNLARNIAFWNGSTWNILTDSNTGISGTNNEIRALAIDDSGILYVGGNFDEAGGNTANRIATWDGSNWSTLGSGTSGFVEAIAINANEVFVGGNFAIAGGNTVNRIAKWNTSNNSWSSLNLGVSNIVNALIHDGTYLYAGGSFNLANTDLNNSDIVNNIARWSEASGWQALGNTTEVGVDNKINDIQFAKDVNGIDKLFAGGNFTQAGTINTMQTAIWVSNDLLSINQPEAQKNIYPNPTSGVLNLNKEYQWVLFDNLGRKLNSGIGKSISLESLNFGIYFLKLNTSGIYKIIKN